MNHNKRRAFVQNWSMQNYVTNQRNQEQLSNLRYIISCQIEKLLKLKIQITHKHDSTAKFCPVMINATKFLLSSCWYPFDFCLTISIFPIKCLVSSFVCMLLWCIKWWGNTLESVKCVFILHKINKEIFTHVFFQLKEFPCSCNNYSVPTYLPS